MSDVIELRVDRHQYSSEERFHLLAAALPIGVCYLDAFGDCLFVNRRWQEISGFSIEEMLGTAWILVIDPESRAEAMADWSRNRQVEYVSEFRLAAMHGEIRWGRFRLAPMSDQRGTIIGFSGTLDDVSERHEAEAILIRERDDAIRSAKSRAGFLATMSREIRTPMNSIIGMANMLLDSALPPQHRDQAETIRNSSESLIAILDDIQDFSKIEAGELLFNEVDFNVSELAESVVELMAMRAQSKGIELGSVIQAGTPSLLHGDPGRLRQVLGNLLSNAIKFTETGEVFVTVGPGPAGDTVPTLRFEVRDTGLGITAEQQRLLFNPYSQAEDSTARRFGGTRLGLAISKQLVALMGGEIGVESKPGEGSRFWFTVRLAEAGAGQAAVKDISGLEGLRILVVDDNASHRRALSQQFESWRMVPTGVASGAEALLMLRTAAEAGKPCAIAVIDLMMPGMDGLELARTIKRDALIAKTRLLLMTGLNRQVEREAIASAGVENHLVKPIRQSRLFDVIHQMVMAQKCLPDASSNRRGTGEVFQKPVMRTTRVLVADDSLVNRKVAVAQLRKLRYEADVASDGKEVLEALARTHYDIILMDVEMPELDGCEATRQIRRAEQEGRLQRPRPVRIIAMTANAMRGDREHCLAAGMDDYISKPVRSDLLEAAMLRSTPFDPASTQDSVSQGAADNAQASGVPQSHGECPVDMDRLNELACDNPEEVRELVRIFLDQGQNVLTALRGAVNKGDAAGTSKLAHKLAGSGATCGMTAVVGPLRLGRAK